MAMRYSPNCGVGSRTFVIKLLMIYGPVFWVLLCSQNYSYGIGGVCWKIWNLSDDFVACHCWIWTDMLNCMFCFWV